MVSRKEEAYLYDEASPKWNIALTPTTHSQMLSTTEKIAQSPNPYSVDSGRHHQPHMTDTCLYDIPEVRPAPAVKNQNALSAASMQQPSSDGVYMALNPASLVSNHQSQGEQQYMAPSTATRQGAAKDVEEPQYVNSQKALGKV